MRVLLAAVLVTAFAAGASAEVRLVEPVPAIEKLPDPIRSAVPEGQTVFRHPDGDAHFMVPYRGGHWLGNIQVVDFNLTQGRARLFELATTGRPLHGVIVHPSGRIMMGGYGCTPAALFWYDPATGAVSDQLKFSQPFDSSVQTGLVGTDGKIYLGSAPWGMLARYDPAVDKEIQVLPLREDRHGGQYVESLATDGRYIYCAMGQHVRYLMVYDQASGERREFLRGDVPLMVMRDAQGRAFCRMGKTLYRLAEGKPRELTPAEVARARPQSPHFYAGIWCRRAVGIMEKVGYEIREDRLLPDGAGEVAIRYRREGGGEWQRLTAGPLKLYPYSIRCLTQLADNTLFGTGDLYSPPFRFDPAPGKSAYVGPSYGNTYSLLADGPLLYMVGYPDVQTVYDTRRPWDPALRTMHTRTGNPHALDLGGEFRGTHLARAADGCVYSAWDHYRRSTGCHLARYNPQTGRSERVWRHAAYQIDDLKASANGRYLLMTCSSQRVGSALVVYDTTAAAARDAVTVYPMPYKAWAKLVGVGEAADALIISRDGLVLRVRGTDGKVLWQRRLPDEQQPFGWGHYYWNWNAERGPDGAAYAILGKRSEEHFCRIDPVDGSVRTLARPGACRILFVGNDVFFYGDAFQRIRNLFAPLH